MAYARPNALTLSTVVTAAWFAKVAFASKAPRAPRIPTAARIRCALMARVPTVLRLPPVFPAVTAPQDKVVSLGYVSLVPKIPIALPAGRALTAHAWQTRLVIRPAIARPWKCASLEHVCLPVDAARPVIAQLVSSVSQTRAFLRQHAPKILIVQPTRSASTVPVSLKLRARLIPNARMEHSVRMEFVRHSEHVLQPASAAAARFVREGCASPSQNATMTAIALLARSASLASVIRLVTTPTSALAAMCAREGSALPEAVPLMAIVSRLRRAWMGHASPWLVLPIVIAPRARYVEAENVFCRPRASITTTASWTNFVNRAPALS